MTLILSNDDIEAVLTMSECVAVIEDAYIELSEGRAVSRRRSDSIVPTSRPDALYGLKTMDGVAPKLGVGAVRINSDILTWPERDGARRRVKVPAAPGQRYVGLVLLFSCETGEPLAIFPDGVAQRMRVGATNGLAARHLAREDSATVGLLGSGWQAGAQLMAITAVRPIERVRCFSPNRENREAFCREMSAALGIEVAPVSAPEAAFRGADVAICATSSIGHVFFERWVEPGMYLSSIKRAEIEPNAVGRAALTVIHARDTAPLQVTTKGLHVPEEEVGESRALSREIDFDSLPTLPDLAAGKVAGRQAAGDVTCFLNNIGIGYQFAAIGALIYRKAREADLGNELPTEWFTEDVHP